MNVVTVSQAKQRLDSLMEQIITDVEPTIICSDKDEKAVLMSLDEFNLWQETFYLIANPANFEHLRKSIAEAKVGKTIKRRLIEV